MPYADKEKQKAARDRYRAANAERLRQYRRDWYARNREEVCARNKTPEARARARKAELAYRERNRDKAREYQRQRREANREEVNGAARLIAARLRAANPQHYRDLARQWRDRNPEKVRETARRCYLNRTEEQQEMYRAKQTLAQRTGLLRGQIPAELAEAEALRLKILREVRKYK